MFTEDYCYRDLAAEASNMIYSPGVVGRGDEVCYVRRQLKVRFNFTLIVAYNNANIPNCYYYTYITSARKLFGMRSSKVTVINAYTVVKLLILQFITQ